MAFAFPTFRAVATLPVAICAGHAQAHVSHTGRNFGTFEGASSASATISRRGTAPIEPSITLACASRMVAAMPASASSAMRKLSRTGSLEVAITRTSRLSSA